MDEKTAVNSVVENVELSENTVFIYADNASEKKHLKLDSKNIIRR